MNPERTRTPHPSHTGLAVFAGTILVLSTAARAQLVIVNPPGNATVEGGSRISFPWGSGAMDMRYQQICSLSKIPTAAGLLKQIAHRRDNDTIVASADFVAWSPNLTLSVSTSPLAAAHMSGTFADNIGKDVTQVFQGTLNWPAEKKNPPGPTKFVYTIPFQNQFLYISANGDLTFDVQRMKVGVNNNSLFLMDAEASDISSKPQQVTTIGAGCSNPPGKNNVLYYDNWIPGSNYARVLLYNAANGSPAYYSLGLTQLAVPIDMKIIGAPGCNLYHDNQLLISGRTSDPGGAYAGRWEQQYRIPNDPNLAGFSFYSQFALLRDVIIGNPANFSVSDAQKVTFGTFVPGLPAHSEAHAIGIAPTTAVLVQQGYGMITEFTF